MSSLRDLHHNIKEVRVLSPIALTTTVGAGGKVIDLAGYYGCEFVMNYGTRTTTNATVTPVIKEGSVTGTLTSVVDADLLGTEALATIGAAASLVSGTHKNAVKRIGYIGSKRYVTCVLVPAISTSFIGGVTAILGRPLNAPLAT